MTKHAVSTADPTWFKDAVIYEVHVRSFFDSSQNGHGDFPGLTGCLDYLQDLGVNTLWLLPFYPSPQRDDGYDIADYTDINKQYGTLSDFRAFLREAHSRGIRVITELVLNHTSDQHDWFKRARQARPGTPERDFYVWSDTPERYSGTRIIFKDFEHSNWTWDPVAGAYYWHRFYSHQPDLNFDNPQVLTALERVVDFWLGMGVDGLRLDAVPYLFEREGTNCENLRETYDYLRRLRAHVDAKFPGRMLLAEANQWPEDAARYFGEGDMCHMTFHFPLMTRMFVALEMEDRTPIVDILEQTPEIPANCQWAIFLRNHDELTLEMVSEEERDFMYQVYARDQRARINLGIRRRLAPLLGNDRRRMELMNVLLMTMPGSPVIYYGDEIGMGDNYYLGDRNGVRTPMQWSPDKNAGFSRVNPQRLYLPAVIDPEYHYESVNVENQQRNPSSLLWWMKQLIAMRGRHPALGRGDMRMVRQNSAKVLAYTRTLGDDRLLVVVNLSRHPQAVRLALSAHAGSVPVEVFGRTRFPAIGPEEYPLTLTAHGCFILELCPRHSCRGADFHPPVLRRGGAGGWRFLDARLKSALQGNILPDYLRRRAVARGDGAQIITTRLLDALPVGGMSLPAWLCVLDVKRPGGGENRSLLLACVDAQDAARLAVEHPDRYVCTLLGPEEPEHAGNGQGDMPGPGRVEGAMVECTRDQGVLSGLLRLFGQRRRIRGRQGEFAVLHGARGRAIRELIASEPDCAPLPGHNTNELIACGDRALLKLFRHTAEGGNPDLEVVRHLTEKVGFANTPGYLASIQYERPDHEPVVVALLRRFVVSESTAWDMCAAALGRRLNRVLAERPEAPPARRPVLALASQPDDGPPELVDEAMLAAMDRIGWLAASMHLALARDTADPAFAPEPFDKGYRRSVYQDISGKTRRILDNLEQLRPGLPREAASLAARVLDLRPALAARLKRFLETTSGGLKIRVHGELDLRHLLFTGRDFMLVDFEGRTTRSLSARRLKRSPLRDVCDVLSSLSLAAEAALRPLAQARPEDGRLLQPFADHWSSRMGARFLRSYLGTAGSAAFLPSGLEKLSLVLCTFQMDQAFFELDRALSGWRGEAEIDPREQTDLRAMLRNLCWLLSGETADAPEEDES